MEEILLYEAAIDADDGTGDTLQLKIEVPLSAAKMLTLHSDDAQASNQVTIDVVGMCRRQIITSRPGPCQECKNKPATQVGGSTVRLDRPGGLEPPKVIDENIWCICGDEGCVTRAAKRSRRLLKRAEKTDWDPDVTNYVRACQKCGKEERKDGPRLMKCSRCRNVMYCGTECQKADWKGHKSYCSKVASKKPSKK